MSKPKPDPLSSAERRLRAQLAVHTSWANTTDRTARTAPATAASMARFETQVDPDGLLPPEERARRAEHLRKAHMAKLAFASARARKVKGTTTKKAAA